MEHLKCIQLYANKAISSGKLHIIMKSDSSGYTLDALLLTVS